MRRKVFRGAIPTSRARLASATPHRISGETPSQFLWKPRQLDMWGNATFGDCVTAEEAFAKACHAPEIFIPAHKIIKWARNHFVLNGAGLWEVMCLMGTEGIAHDNRVYQDGPFTSVNWSDQATLQNAITKGPVKLGVAGDQLENDVWQIKPYNGWYASGLVAGGVQDHCVSLCGYGTVAWLASQLSVPNPSPSSRQTDIAYAMFTWDSIGIIDYPSLLAITGEAWLRNPTTIVQD